MSADDIIIVGRHLLCTYITRKCVCKCVDMYMITLLCTWRIYVFSEHLLVNNVLGWMVIVYIQSEILHLDGLLRASLLLLA